MGNLAARRRQQVDASPPGESQVIWMVIRRRLPAVVCAVAACVSVVSVRAADAPANAARERPNVVVLVLDTLRADYVGAYGGRALTPNIDRLARLGLRF